MSTLIFDMDIDSENNYDSNHEESFFLKNKFNIQNNKKNIFEIKIENENESESESESENEIESIILNNLDFEIIDLVKNPNKKAKFINKQNNTNILNNAISHDKKINEYNIQALNDNKEMLENMKDNYSIHYFDYMKKIHN